VSVRLTPEAEADLAEAVRWYRSHGVQVVERFRRAVTSGLALIDQYPSGQPILYRTVRRVLVPRFPYTLLYYLDADDAVVFGCFHTARDPKNWQERADAALD
jgi:toxin ParE1/3/4